MAKFNSSVPADVTPGNRSEGADQASPEGSLTTSLDPAPGAPPSNTAPANSNSPFSGTLLLRSGVDSLYVSYPGSLPQHKADQLETLKLLAQSPLILDHAQAVLALGGHRFEVRDRGKGRFPYVLVDNWYHLQVSGYKASRMPLAYVQIRSELLTLTGWQTALADLTATVRELENSTDEPSLSRVDLCVDFVTDEVLGALPIEAWVARAKQQSRYHTAGRFTGLSFGLGGDLSGRLYDKTEEIRKSRKWYLEPLWQAAGWDGKRAVWRLEFQFNRAVLRELGVERAQDLEKSLGGLWRYATQEWLRLAIPNPHDTTRTRWVSHPLWTLLANVGWDQDAGDDLSRVQKARVPDDRYLFVNGISGITSYMAREGISDFQDGLFGFIRDALDFHRLQGFDRKEDLHTYALAKAQEKARRYNTLINPGDPARGSDAGED